MTRAAVILRSWIGAFLGIASVGLAHRFLESATDQVLIIGSFGASAVLLYGACDSPLAQPRNLLGGHFLSGLVGVFCQQLFPDQPWLAGALAVATATSLMQITHTLHPPGGATALIAVIGSPQIHRLGYGYALVPAELGAVILLLIALLVMNFPNRRHYPLSLRNRRASVQGP
ncbi:MAG: HPP family protein [Magnetococcales bacterium]|nr:HPP family protein [Magnetococcales bacterium]MBF0155833.1 HPP family protein [Magnetococcales bacterium]